jgi:hypothetical protein
MNGQLRILVQGKPTPTAQPSSGIENRHKSVCTVSGRIAGGILPASERRRSVTGSGRNNLALLSGVLVSLPLSTTSTLGRCTLVTKGCPRTKVLASLAPLDFNTGTTSSAVFGFSKQPNCYVAHCTNTLVLTGNNMRRGGLAALVRIVLATSARVSRHQCRRTTSHFAAHDAGFESVGGDGFVALPTARQIVGKIDQPGKVRQRMVQKRVRRVLQNVVTADTSGDVRERRGEQVMHTNSNLRPVFVRYWIGHDHTAIHSRLGGSLGYSIHGILGSGRSVSYWHHRVRRHTSRW